MNRGRTVLLVPKLQHELVTCLKVFRWLKSFFVGAGRDPKLEGEGAAMWNAGLSLPSLARRRGGDLGVSNKAAGPWMVSAGGVALLTRVTYSYGRRREESHPLPCSSVTGYV